MLKKTKAVNFFLLIIFYLLLNYTYFFIISDLWFVRKLKLTASFNEYKFIIGTAIALTVVFVSTIVKVKPFIYSFLCIISCILIFPAIILIKYSHDDWRTVISPLILFILILIMSKVKMRFSTSRFGERKSFRILLLVSIVGLIPFFVVYAPYIQVQNLWLSDIYETRAMVSSNVNNIYTTYTYQWFAKYIIPSVLIFGIAYKNKPVIIGSVLAMIFLFLCGANKAVYFGIFMVIVFSLGSHLTKTKYFIYFLITVALFGLFVFYTFDYNEIIRMSIRRLIFIPPLLDTVYFDFFDENYLYWYESITSSWIEPQYDMHHSYLIGEKYFNNKLMSANNGIFSDGFMNLGMIGVFINSLIVATALSFFSQLNIHPKFFGLFFLLFIPIISSSMTTVLVTHGMIFLVAFSQIFLKDTNDNL